MFAFRRCESFFRLRTHAHTHHPRHQSSFRQRGWYRGGLIEFVLVSVYPGAWKQLVLAVDMKHLAIKVSYPTWLGIFQRKESFSVYSENWSFSDAVRECKLPLFLFATIASIRSCTDHTAYALVHTCARHLLKLRARSECGNTASSPSWTGGGSVWEGGSGAVTGGTAKPDVDVLFAQAGQLRSRRVKLLHLLATTGSNQAVKWNKEAAASLVK